MMMIIRIITVTIINIINNNDNNKCLFLSASSLKSTYPFHNQKQSKHKNKLTSKKHCTWRKAMIELNNAKTKDGNKINI